MSGSSIVSNFIFVILNFISANVSCLSENQEFVRPVIIHRAILGTVERMIAILTESYAGKWPFWLSPRQAITIPVAPPHNDYAIEVNELCLLFCVFFLETQSVYLKLNYYFTTQLREY